MTFEEWWVGNAAAAEYYYDDIQHVADTAYAAGHAAGVKEGREAMRAEAIEVLKFDAPDCIYLLREL